jgi:hypothetical protein
MMENEGCGQCSVMMPLHLYAGKILVKPPEYFKGNNLSIQTTRYTTYFQAVSIALLLQDTACDASSILVVKNNSMTFIFCKVVS